MKEAGIKIATPLMMDLEACFQERAIKPDENYVPYACYPENGNEDTQINQISKIVDKYPWQIFPFIMFNPRRKNAVEICKKALENKGFLGIKLYPALGHFPVPGAGQSQEIAVARNHQNLQPQGKFCPFWRNQYQTSPRPRDTVIP